MSEQRYPQNDTCWKCGGTLYGIVPCAHCMSDAINDRDLWRALAVELGEALRGYERWEATVIMDGACWPWDAPMALTRERYDEMIALQRPRNAVLRRLQERQEAGR